MRWARGGPHGGFEMPRRQASRVSQALWQAPSHVMQASHVPQASLVSEASMCVTARACHHT